MKPSIQASEHERSYSNRMLGLVAMIIVMVGVPNGRVVLVGAAPRVVSGIHVIALHEMSLICRVVELVVHPITRIRNEQILLRVSIS